MQIPLNVQVHCLDGYVGTSKSVIVDPLTVQVTHLVVKTRQFPHPEVMVPMAHITHTTPAKIELNCAQSSLAKMDTFDETNFIRMDMPEYPEEPQMVWPHVTLDAEFLELGKGYLQAGEQVAIQRGTRLEAQDGYIGRIDEFIVNPENGEITHLLLRKGHQWGPREVAIPITEIAAIETDKVFLKLDKERVAQLPVLKVNRLWE